MSSSNNQVPSRTLFGHPPGLFTLFFAEMWERFSYYGMRALLVFYMIKGFLGYGDSDAYAVYGAYTALVYMTPFFGGMLADRLLGARRAVILGGLLMAAGHLMMTVENDVAFFTALALLICGNGFFKPNISAIVGSLYAPGSPKRDGGFTIFYMGINLGAAMSPLLCGYIGETYGYHYGFGLATIGMLTGVAVFVAPTLVTQLLITAGASAAAVGLLTYHPDNPFSIGVNVFVGVSLLAAGATALVALGRGGLPTEAGAPPDRDRLRRRLAGLIPTEWTVYLGTVLFIPVFVLLVSGFAPLTDDRRPVTLVPESVIKDLSAGEMMQTQLKALREAVESKSQATVARLAERCEALGEDRHLRDRQYTALKEAVGLAKARQWENARVKVSQLEQRFPRERIKAVLAVVLKEMSKPAGLILLVCGLVAFVYLGVETLRLDTVPRQRMYVVLILTFFSMLFWSFFEQAGSSVNNFTDRNIDRVSEATYVAQRDVGSTVRFRVPPETDDPELMNLPLLSQEQLGHRYGNEAVNAQIEQAIRSQEEDKIEGEPNPQQLEKINRRVKAVTGGHVLTLTALTYLRAAAAEDDAQRAQKTIDWVLTEENLGMGIGGSEIPASVFQSVNPIYILIFGLVFTALWAVLAKRGLEPSTPVKFALGLFQLGLGFGAFWYGAQIADHRGMVALGWLLLGYLLQTTGELCLSPVGLSMVTKLSPPRLVSTVMGTWFLATAFSQFLAAIIAQFTGVPREGEDEQIIPVPSETVDLYGNVFGKIAMAAILSALICFALSPLLSRWMHPEADLSDGAEAPDEA